MPKHSVPFWRIAAFSLALALPGLLAITPGDPIAVAGTSGSHGPAPVRPNPHRLGQEERTTIYLPVLDRSMILDEAERIQDLADGTAGAVAAEGSRSYLVQRGNQLGVYDVTVLDQPRLLGSVELPFESRAQQIVPAGDRIHVVLSSFGHPICPVPGQVECSVVVEVDVRDPTQPKVAGYGRVSGMSLTIALAGGTLYLITERESSESREMLRIIDVQIPEVPREVAATELPFPVDEAIVLDKQLLAVGEGLLRYDISDPERPTLLEQSEGIARPVLMARSGTDVVVVAADGKVRILHWRNGISLERFTDLQLSFEPVREQLNLHFAYLDEAAVVDQRLVVFHRNGICALRIGVCSNSRILAVYDLAGAPAFIGAIQVSRVGALEYSYPRSFSMAALPGHLLVSGGLSGGFSVVDVASPEAPRELERREILGGLSASWLNR